MYRAGFMALFLHNTPPVRRGIMNDITFAASRLAVHRADELALASEHRRVIAERTADCVPPPVREQPRVRFPQLRLPQLHFPRSPRPAL
jgi:hypothetical protein